MHISKWKDPIWNHNRLDSPNHIAMKRSVVNQVLEAKKTNRLSTEVFQESETAVCDTTMVPNVIIQFIQTQRCSAQEGTLAIKW